MEGSLAASQEKIAADLKAVIADTEDLLKATADQTGEKMKEVRARAEESLRVARDRVVEMEQAAVKATDDYVRANPWQAVGIAAGVGFFLGWLIGRR
jgi:ElaB/YqjD/DUF883 family membrane-anchored ribosome-binding protein